MKETKYKGYYITKDGKVWSAKSNKFLSISMHGDYLGTAIIENGKVIRVNIHRLLAEAYIPNPHNYPQVNHIDENKLNNSLDNLEWVTAQQNANHGTRNKRISETNKKVFANTNVRGGKHPEAVAIQMCDKQTHEIIKEFESIADACIYLNRYPTGQGNISNVLKGTKNSAYGYFWQRKK